MYCNSVIYNMSIYFLSVLSIKGTFFSWTQEQEHDLTSFTKFKSTTHRQNVADDFIYRYLCAVRQLLE